MEPITIGIVCTLIGWGIKSWNDSSTRNEKQKTKQAKIDSDKQIQLAKIDAERKAIEARNTENEKLRKEKEKDDAILEIVALKNKIDELKNKSKETEDKIKNNEKKNDESQKNINDIKSKFGGLEFDFDLTDYLNIETAVIVVGVIVLYKLLKDKD